MVITRASLGAARQASTPVTLENTQRVRKKAPSLPRGLSSPVDGQLAQPASEKLYHSLDYCSSLLADNGTPYLRRSKYPRDRGDPSCLMGDEFFQTTLAHQQPTMLLLAPATPRC